MKKRVISLIISVLAINMSLFAQSNLLQSGPMVGYSSFKEVMLWVQTTEAAKVHFIYYDKEKPNIKLKTETVQTSSQTVFVAKALALVQPGKKYTYELYINGKLVSRPYPLEFQSQVLWQWRTDPPAFKFAFGSCNYVNETEVDRPGTPYGGEHQIFNSILQKKPDFMLWAGDNTYLREVDWDTRSGIMHRYTHSRKLPEVQALLGGSHHYAIWDDHEYGPNDADRGYYLKNTTLEAFKLFWANPNYIFDNQAITGTFNWADVQFFLIDDRWFRTPKDLRVGEKEMLGKMQMQWLIDALAASEAPFKFVVVGGQVINSMDDPRLETYSYFSEERNQLLQAIRDNRIPGVIFLSGDRHHTELSKMERAGTYPLYDVTVSPLTAGSVGDRALNEKNIFRVPNTYYGQRNFATFEVSGPRKERVLNITIWNVEGKEVWKQEIKAVDLK
jgi:alkaline phosphatase D